MQQCYDVVIIGGGVVGSAIARELSRWRLRIAVLEKESDVCTQTSGRNTGMPIGSTTAILAQKYGADAQFASKCVFISTLTSLVTVPILTLFL